MTEMTREQLVELKTALESEIEILRSPLSYGLGSIPISSHDPQKLAELEGELAAVNARLGVQTPDRPA